MAKRQTIKDWTNSTEGPQNFFFSVHTFGLKNTKDYIKYGEKVLKDFKVNKHALEWYDGIGYVMLTADLKYTNYRMLGPRAFFFKG